MRRFFHRKRPPCAPADASLQRDPFDVIPLHHPDAEARLDDAGCNQIRLRLNPPRGLGGLIARRLGFHRDVRINLDEQGSFFWSQVDGAKSLRDIEPLIRFRFALKEDQSKEATLLFTRSLMLRHLLLLKVEPKEEGAPHGR